jgi:hypothetical protein
MTDRETVIADLFGKYLSGEDLTNTLRAARIMGSILPTYMDGAEAAFRDAISDMYHAADMLGLDFDAERRAAYAAYSEEVFDDAPATIPVGEDNADA